MLLSWALWTALGLAIGSCANVIVWRLPRKLLGLSTDGLAWPASHCPQCKCRLHAWELLPVLSFLHLRGRCHHCHGKISWRYPVLELAATGIFAYCAMRFGFGWTALIWAVAWVVFLILALIDWDFFLLPDRLTLLLLLAGLLFAASGWDTALNWQTALLGAGCAYAVLGGVAWVFKKIRKKNGLGAGDIKLFTALGAWMGYKPLWTILFLAALLGLVFVGVRWLFTRQLSSSAAHYAYSEQSDEPHQSNTYQVWLADIPAGAIPFGTALVLSAFLYWAGIGYWLEAQLHGAFWHAL